MTYHTEWAEQLGEVLKYFSLVVNGLLVGHNPFRQRDDRSVALSHCIPRMLVSLFSSAVSFAVQSSLTVGCLMPRH